MATGVASGWPSRACSEPGGVFAQVVAVPAAEHGARAAPSDVGPAGGGISGATKDRADIGRDRTPGRPSTVAPARQHHRLLEASISRTRFQCLRLESLFHHIVVADRGAAGRQKRQRHSIARQTRRVATVSGAMPRSTPPPS